MFILFHDFHENRGFSSCWEIPACWEILRRPPKPRFSGFPSTGPLCGAFNRCIFLLRDFGNWEMLSKSHFLVPKTAWNDLFFLGKNRPCPGGPFSRKKSDCVSGGKSQLSIVEGSTGAWKDFEIFPRFRPRGTGKYRALYLAWVLKGDELMETSNSLYESWLFFGTLIGFYSDVVNHDRKHRKCIIICSFPA